MAQTPSSRVKAAGTTVGKVYSPPAPRASTATRTSTRSKVAKVSISMLQLAMLTVVAVASLRSLPTAATYGLGSIALYVIPAVLFLVPTALVAAELATGWKGGIYVWVREALGNRWGFAAVWLQWIQNVVWFPVQLAFVAAALGFVFGRDTLGNSGLYTAIIILVFYWVSTAVTLAGNNLFARVGAWGGWIGTIIPGALLIILFLGWMLTKQPSQTPLTLAALNPLTSSSSSGGSSAGFLAFLAPFVLVVSNFLAYAGMEVNAVHVNEMKNPGKDYPKAILIATILILAVFIIPTIAVAVIVPAKSLGLTTGINVAFQMYFAHWNMSWLTPIVSLMIVVGALASVVTWIAGPSKGVLLASRTGLLPLKLQKQNKHGIQLGILILQGIIVSLLALLFIFIPNVSTAFFTLVDMAAALYLIMYMFMFAAVIILRRKQPDVKRAYRVPALKLVAGVGFAASLAAFLLGFIPPSQLPGIPSWAYPLLMLAVVVVLGVPSLIFYAIKKPDWKTISDEEFLSQSSPQSKPPSQV